MSSNDDDLPPVLGDSQSSTAASLVAWQRHRREQAFRAATSTGSSGVFTSVGNSTIFLEGHAPTVQISVPEAQLVASAPPEVALSTLVDLGTRTDEGQLIIAVTPAWHAIVGELERDPNALHRLLDSRQGEQLIAGAYQAYGWSVTLTPRSGDGGIDIIAERHDVGSIRIIDQMKLYNPNHLVKADEVRAMWGVLDRDRRASKAVITTTSGFAPGVRKEFADSIPTRLDLRDGAALHKWLQAAVKK